jgi:hypothetical protein
MSAGLVGTGERVRALNRSISVRPSQLYASNARRSSLGTDRYAAPTPSNVAIAATTSCAAGSRSATNGVTRMAITMATAAQIRSARSSTEKARIIATLRSGKASRPCSVMRRL